MATDRTHITFPDGSSLIFRYTNESLGTIERVQLQRGSAHAVSVAIERKDNPELRIVLDSAANVDVAAFGFVYHPTNRALRNCAIFTNYQPEAGIAASGGKGSGKA